MLLGTAGAPAEETAPTSYSAILLAWGWFPGAGLGTYPLSENAELQPGGDSASPAVWSIGVEVMLAI